MIEEILRLFFSEPLFSAMGILGLLIFLLLLLVVGFIGYLILMLIDYAWLPTKNGNGFITRKTFTPAHTETHMRYNVALKMSTPTTVFYDDAWVLFIRVGNQEDDFQVTEDAYNNFSVNQKLNVDYSIGRLFNTLYIKRIK